MKVTTWSPSPRVARFVRAFTIVETDDSDATRMLMPDTGLIVGLRFSGSATQLDGDVRVRMPDASIAGMRSTARRMYTSPNAGVVLAAFHPGRATRLVSEPLHELFGDTIALDDVIPRSEVEDVRARIAEAVDHAQRVAIFEEFLLAQQLERDPDAVVAEAVQALEKTRGTVRIATLARHLGIAQDPLEKRFRRFVGASPKQFASIVRLRHAIDAVRSGANLTRASIDAGYFDQSHFNREFRAVTGDAPGRFFGSGESC